jgi:hypothetical protein
MTFTIETLHEIAKAEGLAHARFCAEQAATQIGRDEMADVFAELARMERAAEIADAA